MKGTTVSIANVVIQSALDPTFVFLVDIAEAPEHGCAARFRVQHQTGDRERRKIAGTRTGEARFGGYFCYSFNFGGNTVNPEKMGPRDLPVYRVADASIHFYLHGLESGEYKEAAKPEKERGGEERLQECIDEESTARRSHVPAYGNTPASG